VDREAEAGERAGSFARLLIRPVGSVGRDTLQGSTRDRAAPGRSRKQIDGLPPDDWHLGELPPEIAAPVLLTCAIFVASETETRIPGVNWDRRVLADGEAPAINTQTLVWHLTFAEGETLRKMFDESQGRPFRALLSALATDRRGLAAEHEAKRRLWALRNVGVATRTEARPAGWHRRRLASMRAAPRYTMNRLEQDAFPVRPVPRSGHGHDEAATAVRMALAPTPLMTPVICRSSTELCSATDTSTIG
jgi:hypothetical protein